MSYLRVAITAAVALSLFACGGSEPEATKTDRPVTPGPVDPPVDPVEPVDPPVDPVEPVDPPVDPVDPVDPVEPVDPPVKPHPQCKALGMPTRALLEGEGAELGQRAGDFTVTELGGARWALKAHWTGCDSYLFFTLIPGDAAAEQVWGSDPKALVGALKNTHVFFLVQAPTPAARETRLRQLQTALATAVAALPTPKAQQAAQARLHLVTDAPAQIEGSVGGFVQAYEAARQDPSTRVDLGERGMAPMPPLYVFGIDRDQRWDAGGSLSERVGGDASLQMGSFLPAFYNHKARIAARFAAEQAHEVVLVDTSTTGRIFKVAPALPALADFNRLVFDVRIRCPHKNVFACSEWDRIARIELCESETCAAPQELARWITPYWRRGERRWAIDASPLLPLLTQGTNHLRVHTGPSWERATEREVYVALRLSSWGGETRPRHVERVFTGGAFEAGYNPRPPLRFTPPADAQRVQLVTILSGHGQAEGSYCAEWCDHRHHFSLNDQEVITLRPGAIGSPLGCAKRAGEGAVPGQWGNWAASRAYWCPGLPVKAIRRLLPGVQLGAENTLRYQASYAGSPTLPGGDIQLSAYLVWY